MNDRISSYRKTAVKHVWAAGGAAVAIALALRLVADEHSLFLLASLGGSTVFLFALTEAEAAQPRALFGGHLGGSFIGILCFQVFGGALWVSVVAVAVTLVFMMATRTVHPPAGANPLIMVRSHAGYHALINPVMVGVLTLFLVALLWSRLRPGRRYPIRWW